MTPGQDRPLRYLLGGSDRRPTWTQAQPEVALTVAMPVYNERDVLRRLHAQVAAAAAAVTPSYEILFVDDGSKDGSAQELRAIADSDPHVSIVTLSRNFGQPSALTAAVDLARGRSLILMDADLQDDPALIPTLVRTHEETGAEVVYVAHRDRDGGRLMSAVFRTFHRLLSSRAEFHVPQNAGTFGLLGPRALTEVRSLTERLRYFPGLRAFVGFPQVAVEARRGLRYDKHSRVGMLGLVRLAGLALFSQSRLAVNLLYGLSALSLLAALGLTTYAVAGKATGIALPAWASIVTAISFFSSTIILGQALIAEYLARVYEEVRGRPPYIVQDLRVGTPAVEGADVDALH